MDYLDRANQMELAAQRRKADEELQKKRKAEREAENKELRRRAAEQVAAEDKFKKTVSKGLESIPRFHTVPISGTTLGGGVAAGGLGALNNQDIILTIERPIWYKPKDYSKLIGYPTDKAVRLGSLEGFCVISKCHLRCAATLEEQDMIMEHFRQGVIF